MTRLVAALTAAVMVVALSPVAAGAAPADGDAPRALEATARGSVLAGLVNVQPRFDPAVADSRSSSSNVGTSSLQSVLWPGFLVDAFFFLYGFQSVERVGLGISEARWPQGPEEAEGTLSNLAFANGGDPNAVPARAGRSYALAGATGASGDVAGTALSLSGGVRIGEATSDSSVLTSGSRARSVARQAVTDLVAGPLAVTSIRGEASADAGGAAPLATQQLVIAGASVAGTPVTIDAHGVRAATESGQRQVNDALKAAGMTVRIVPASEEESAEFAAASSGGLLVQLEMSAQEPSGTARDVQLGYVLGSAQAAARATTILAPPPLLDGPALVQDPPRTFTRTIVIPPAPAPGGGIGAAPAKIIRRRIVVTGATTAVPGGARGAYGAVVLLALGLLGIRPLVRATSRT